ncbi:hypothetical protein [Acetobacter orientalis]|uniref:hypothetical protein n=1 Tax=Acetobacter orientalis TaxID=146474 RepID=UPI0020A30E82|nr:hypothetical protein [Acetobacter orientalis]MCP1221576.1 hypothetical protein [Acetobacter orientalis]
MTISQRGRKPSLLTLCGLLASAPFLVPSVGLSAPAPAAASGQPEQTAPAAVADHPRLSPGRDATIDYVFQPQPPPELVQAGKVPSGPLPERHVQVLFSGDGGLMRIRYLKDMTDTNPRGSVILNRAAQEVLVILDDRKIYTRLVQQEVARSPFLLDMSMQFVRKNQAQVSGQPCTVWGVQSPQGKGTACVTDDGFILEQDGVDVDGLHGHLKALHVSYDDVPASAFMPPSGYQEVTAHAPQAGAAQNDGSQEGTIPAPATSPVPGVGPTTRMPSGTDNPQGPQPSEATP